MENKTELSNERITMVLVDTSAFTEANSDFIGLNSSLLPSFFDAASEKEIVLLTHPILDREIQKHMEDSSIYKEYQKLISQLGKCKDVLLLAECNDIELFEKITAFDVKAKTHEAFMDNYKNAVRLGYPDPEIIFEQYFAAKPPFSATGKKKNEFPDAFVIESAKQYLVEHPNEVLLVVSKDGDWEKAFFGMDNVLICGSISEAVTKINRIESILSEEIIIELFQSAYKEMLADVQFSAGCECYNISDYEFSEDFETDRIEVTAINDLIVPLKITRSSLLIKTTATISVDGHGVVLDEDSSIWDKEDEVYIYTVYSDLSVTGGKAEVECEIELEFDLDDPAGTVQVSRVKLNNRFDIEVFGGNIELTAIDPEADYYGEMMDTLEDYHLH